MEPAQLDGSGDGSEGEQDRCAEDTIFHTHWGGSMGGCEAWR